MDVVTVCQVASLVFSFHIVLWSISTGRLNPFEMNAFSNPNRDHKWLCYIQLQSCIKGYLEDRGTHTIVQIHQFAN